MIKSGFFDSRGGDRRYTSQDMAYIFQLLMTNGVYANPSTSLQVVAGTNMTVNVSAGFGVINGRYAYNTGDYNITLANANGAYGRIDRIVLRMNMTDRVMQLIALTGTPASTPVAPVIVRDGTFYDLSLATITVAAGATVITQGMITDTRGNAAVCGYITGAVDQIDTTNLFAQYEAEWSLLRAIVAQDSEAIAEALNDIAYIKTVCGVSPDSSKNVQLDLDTIEQRVTLFDGFPSLNTSYTLSQPVTNFKWLRITITNHITSSLEYFTSYGIIKVSDIKYSTNVVYFYSTQIGGSAQQLNILFGSIGSTTTFTSSAALPLKIEGVK